MDEQTERVTIRLTATIDGEEVALGAFSVRRDGDAMRMLTSDDAAIVVSRGGAESIDFLIERTAPPTWEELGEGVPPAVWYPSVEAQRQAEAARLGTGR